MENKHAETIQRIDDLYYAAAQSGLRVDWNKAKNALTQALVDVEQHGFDRGRKPADPCTECTGLGDMVCQACHGESR